MYMYIYTYTYQSIYIDMYIMRYISTYTLISIFSLATHSLCIGVSEYVYVEHWKEAYAQ